MSSRDAQELLGLIKWARDCDPDILDDWFFDQDGWTQLITLQWAKHKREIFDEERMDIIGQNGGNGEHYEECVVNAPQNRSN